MDSNTEQMGGESLGALCFQPEDAAEWGTITCSILEWIPAGPHRSADQPTLDGKGLPE